jgi:segregation and condensation protein B
MKESTRGVEALLFYLNEEVKKKRLAELVGLSLGELEENIQELREERSDSGIVVIDTPTTVSLGTHPDTSELIDSVRAGEKEAPLSKAAMETLAVVAYQAPVTRAEVDTIRGVNSMYSIRNLLVRGLITRRNQENQVIYEPTAETLELLGITTQHELPDYAEVTTKVLQIMGGHSEGGGNEEREEGGEEGAPGRRDE